MNLLILVRPRKSSYRALQSRFQVTIRATIFKRFEAEGRFINHFICRASWLVRVLLTENLICKK